MDDGIIFALLLQFVLQYMYVDKSFFFSQPGDTQPATRATSARKCGCWLAGWLAGWAGADVLSAAAQLLLIHSTSNTSMDFSDYRNVVRCWRYQKERKKDKRAKKPAPIHTYSSTRGFRHYYYRDYSSLVSTEVYNKLERSA